MARRSQQLRWDIMITLEGSSQEESSELLVKLVASHAHRVHTLRIAAPSDFMYRHIPILHDLAAPHMVTLHLLSWAAPSESPDEDAEDQVSERIFTGGAGELSRFKTRYIGLQMQPPLSSLKEIFLFVTLPMSHIPLHEALSEAAQTLTDLNFAICLLSIPALPPCVNMPSLTSMTVHILYQATSSFRFLKMVQAPSLDTLALLGFASNLEIYESTTASFPKLRALHLSGCPGSGVLAAFPTIQELTIRDHLPTPTNMTFALDPNQPAFLTLTPDLARIVAARIYEEPINAFCDARQRAGLTRPKFEPLSDVVSLIQAIVKYKLISINSKQ
ncbi:hypothetical protein HWV62_41192 [Athelia sp. TMB]|nr:hypothetical protein HWV62_41192 [Athelia sp. TMB]